MYLKLNKNSPLLTCKICICSHLRLNSITVIFSTSTRFGIFHPARLIMQMCRIASKTLTWNKLFKRQKKKDDETNLNKEAVFQRWNVFCSLQLTIECNGVVLVWFLQKIRASKMIEYELTCRLKLFQFPPVANWNFSFTHMHMELWHAVATHQWIRKPVLKLKHFRPAIYIFLKTGNNGTKAIQH